MIRLVRGLLDRIVLVAAILAAGCVPSFIAQYRQRIGGQLDQVLADLAPFELIARRDFNGNVATLVQHHQASTDATFRQEGDAVQQMIDAVARLRIAIASLDTDLFGQAWWLVRHPDWQIAQATWRAWQPAFSISVEGLALALVAGLIVWLVFLMVWHGVAALLRPRRRIDRGYPDYTKPLVRIDPHTSPRRP